MNEFLTDLEKEAVEAFYKNEVTREAVKKVLLKAIYQNGTLRKGEAADPMRNFALSLVAGADATLSNEQLGADLRACYWGIQFVENGFRELSKFEKLVAPDEKKANPGS